MTKTLKTVLILLFFMGMLFSVSAGCTVIHDSGNPDREDSSDATSPVSSETNNDSKPSSEKDVVIDESNDYDDQEDISDNKTPANIAEDMSLPEIEITSEENTDDELVDPAETEEPAQDLEEDQITDNSDVNVNDNNVTVLPAIPLEPEDP